jgi:GPH family glycoside/pentoside/hexuronide:cation symporter
MVAPAAMGWIYALARVWDAISDPMAGYLSDRTRSRIGRRRPWLFASVAPLAIAPLLLWSPPESLTGFSLIGWLLLAILFYETAATILIVPHFALGAELSMDHHERTGVFAYRQVAWAIGFFLCVGAMQVITHADDKREAALALAILTGATAAVLVLASAFQIREPTSNVGRGARRSFQAARDVLANRHSRLLVVILLIESLGTATLGIMAPYYMQYVIGDEGAYPLMLLFHFVPSLLVIPVGVALSRRFGKKNLWAASMSCSGLAFGATVFLGEGDLAWVLFFVMGTGIGTGIGAVVGPSVQADIVDFDEYRTGERKEGAYFAILNFVRKAASGITGALAGFALQLVGFEPNMEQSGATRLIIRLLYGGMPFLGMAIGVALFYFRFELDEEEHRRIRTELDARSSKLDPRDSSAR